MCDGESRGLIQMAMTPIGSCGDGSGCRRAIPLRAPSTLVKATENAGYYPAAPKS
ncbi:MAG: hypothetical protein ACT4O2_02035 [Beijerinckiaceae bacterium]